MSKQTVDAYHWRDVDEHIEAATDIILLRQQPQLGRMGRVPGL